jgi:hypothetical protein
MTDKELLERAAKAAGYGDVWYLDRSDTPYVGPKYEIGRPVKYRTFQPLTDDGDAFRLAVELNLDIFTNDGDGGHTSVGGGTDVFVQEKHGTQRLAATRRAIVRAAAALADSEPT